MKWDEYSGHKVTKLVNEIQEFDLDYVIRTMVKAEDLLRDIDSEQFPHKADDHFQYIQLENARKDMTRRKENIDRVFKKLFQTIADYQKDIQQDAMREDRPFNSEIGQEKPYF